MQLRDIFAQLTYGELKQQGIGGFEEGGIQEENYPELVSHLNLALLNVYTRFPVVESSWTLTTEPDKTIYDVDTNVLRLNSAFDSEGEEVPLNDENAEVSIFTPTYSTVQVPLSLTGSIEFLYRSKPTVIVAPGEDATTSEIEDFLNQEVLLPETLAEVTFSYVEYRTLKAAGGELSLTQANQVKQNYEVMCAEIERRNVLNTSVTPTSIKPELGGWV